MLMKYIFVIFMANLSWANHFHPRQHLQIYWNSSNRIFHSLRLITVHLGDLIDFICPAYSSPLDSIEYNTLYLVSQQAYSHCNTSHYNPLFKCHRPLDLQPFIYTLSISKYLPYPNLPEFAEGEFYYFVSTSTGRLTEIDQRQDGLCETKKMKLILHVEKISRLSTNFPQRRRPSVAKRTNVTFIDFHQRFPSLTSNHPSRNDLHHMFLLFVFCLFEKLIVCV